MLLFEQYIKLELIITMWCVGIFIAARQGNILYRVKVILSAFAFRIALLFTFKPKYKPPKETKEEYRIKRAFQKRDEMMKPILSCIDCMSSVHSAIIYTAYKLIFHISFEWIDILIWLSLAVPAVFLNVILWAIVSYLTEYVKALKNSEEEKE